jgi:hypothetical protein
MAAREIVPEFVCEQYGQKGQGKRQAGSQRERLAIEQGESADEFVPRNGLVLRVGRGEVGAGDETSTECQEKQRTSKQEGSQGRMLRNLSVVRGEGCGAPIEGLRRNDGVLWNRIGHEVPRMATMR